MWSFPFAIVAVTLFSKRAVTATLFDEVRLPLDRAPQGFYVATLEVTGQRKRLLVDTGSGDFWVRSRASLAAEKGHRHTFLDKYSGGSVSGNVFSGMVRFKQDTEATCQFGASSEDGLLQNFPSIDGIWGLGPKGSVEGLNVCLERHDRIQSRSFSISLNNRGGTIVLGASSVGFTKLPVVGSGTWSVPLLGISVRSPSDASQPVESQLLINADTALLDTGSSGIHGPTASIERLASALAAERHDDGTLQVRCEAHRPLPDATIQFRTQDGGEISVLLSVRDLLGTINSGGWCPLKLTHSKSGSWILGDAFFQRMNAVVFDYESLVVGISVKPDSLGVNHPQLNKLVVHHDHHHHATVSQHDTTVLHNPMSNTKTISANHTSSKMHDEEQTSMDDKILARQDEDIKSDEEELEELRRGDAEMMAKKNPVLLSRLSPFQTVGSSKTVLASDTATSS
eukprot:gnl/MRDRNA2_/MRDRNA2_28170_c0_seq1.p1 gnl/MRDRNA2_/MRDRNA2_28170_c0~~gnl/MRDRNA2_/MRDRNA2_28170_c0_seq1.p1  ORF type:complete len:455 (+),score=77.76 gnl/MRDRNA2_/MRDRNA2_28170_c0_seq1:219-1583(+)